MTSASDPAVSALRDDRRIRLPKGPTMTTSPEAPVASTSSDDHGLARFGYQPELRRVLGLFDNFSVAFSYLSPMVGVYSLFVLGAGSAGPGYIWLMVPVVVFMLLVALVFGELGSQYPLSGALYQYGKRSVGPAYGWWVGWIYGLALLVTVASVDTGMVGYFAALLNTVFGSKIDATNHGVILGITIALIVVQTVLNSVGAKVMGYVTRIGVYVETVGTFGVAGARAQPRVPPRGGVLARGAPAPWCAPVDSPITPVTYTW